MIMWNKKTEKYEKEKEDFDNFKGKGGNGKIKCGASFLFKNSFNFLYTTNRFI